MASQRNRKGNAYLVVSILIFIISSIAFAQTLSVENIVDKALPSMVRISVYDATGTELALGSGFFIGPGKILTNAHVIKGAYSAAVHSSLNFYDQVTIDKSDENLDLALLSVEELGEPSLALADSVELRPGQRIIAIGNPFGFENTVTDGLISAIREPIGLAEYIQISAPLSPGSSGGPILNLQGSVIGITSATISVGQNLNFAVSVKSIKEFLLRPSKPVPLKKARTRVLWKIILKRFVNIVLLIIGFVFGGGWWVLLIAIMILYYILKWLWKALSAPFRKTYKQKNLFIEENPSLSLPIYPPTIQTSLFTGENEHNEHKDDKDDKDNEKIEGDKDKYFYFYCWACGNLVVFDKSKGTDTIECSRCGTSLSVPKISGPRKRPY